jgi:hypothetical protein
MYACVLASGVTQLVAVEVTKSLRGAGSWGCVALVLGKDYYCVGIRSVLAWSDNGALLSQGNRGKWMERRPLQPVLSPGLQESLPKSQPS